MQKKPNVINVGWIGGVSSLFLAPQKTGGYEVLDYYSDWKRIHEQCGGRITEGYFNEYIDTKGYIRYLRNFIMVGSYSVDKSYPWEKAVPVAGVIDVMLPYRAYHSAEDNRELLKKYPVVMHMSDEECETVIFADFYKDFPEILQTLFLAEKVEGTKIIRKKFFSPVDEREHKVSIYFANPSKYTNVNPWEFVEGIYSYQVFPSDEKVLQLLHIGEFPNMLVGTTKMQDLFFATKKYECNFLDYLETDFNGWKCLAPNLMMKKRRHNKLHLLYWVPVKEAYEERIHRMEYFIHESQQKSFVRFMKRTLLQFGKFVYCELKVDRKTFYSNPSAILNKMRLKMEQKISQNLLLEKNLFLQMKKESVVS